MIFMLHYKNVLETLNENFYSIKLKKLKISFSITLILSKTLRCSNLYFDSLKFSTYVLLFLSFFLPYPAVFVWGITSNSGFFLLLWILHHCREGLQILTYIQPLWPSSSGFCFRFFICFIEYHTYCDMQKVGCSNSGAKTSSVSSTAKRSAMGVSVTGPRR